MQCFIMSKVWISFVLTIAFSLAVALIVWLLDLTNSLWLAILVSLCIGGSLNLTFVLFESRVRQLLPDYLVPIPLVAIGFVVGLLLAGTLSYGDPVFFFTLHPTLIVAVFFAIVGSSIIYTHQKLLHTRARLAQVEAERHEQEKLLIESKLNLLQAQIEPHFLFNSLSNIIGLIRHAPDVAERSLINLTTLLRASLQKTRSSSTMLAEELKLVKAYLDIQSMRMPGRLHYEIRPSDLLTESGENDALRRLSIPPLLLQPLLENSVNHGIEPLESGGTITIETRIDNGQVIISITDTGVGFGDHTTSANDVMRFGTGLNNVRQRLQALHGEAASMQIYNNSPTGGVVKLTFPLTEHGN